MDIEYFFDLLLILILYFVPAIVAGRRRLKVGGAIFTLDLFLGWTVIGWIAALVWALGAQDVNGESAP